MSHPERSESLPRAIERGGSGGLASASGTQPASSPHTSAPRNDSVVHLHTVARRGKIVILNDLMQRDYR
jgi:hypothetical protein